MRRKNVTPTHNSQRTTHNSQLKVVSSVTVCKRHKHRVAAPRKASGEADQARVFLGQVQNNDVLQRERLEVHLNAWANARVRVREEGRVRVRVRVRVGVGVGVGVGVRVGVQGFRGPGCAWPLPP